MEELEERLKQINMEEYIWIIYLGIIFLSYYSNTFEKDFLINDNTDSKEKYRYLNIIIFTIAVLVYLYFTVDSYKSFINLTEADNEEKKKLTLLSFIGSFLILISGIIFLYIAYEDKDIQTEIAFN
jgi:amino acid transporter